MWPFSSYPEYSPSQVDGKIYDYIIVGGGTAGCVIASRLSEDRDVSVLVLERGHVKDNVVSRMPLVSQNMFLGNTLQVQSNRWSEPMPGANRRRNRLWAVEGIGGATRMNAMLWTRGFPGDYAAWYEMGLKDWAYEKLEPYFRKIENAVAHPKSSSRGHKGPIELRQFTYPFIWTTYIEKAVQKLGLRLEKDTNDPTAPAMGYFNLDTSIDAHGRRISAFSAYLNKTVALRRRGHLAVCTGAVASRLDADAQTGLVTGVHIRCSSGLPKEFFVKARREVIVCSGAACTPQLLLLSGIGPKQSSEKFGIPLVKELPAVGATLSDHYSIPIMLEVQPKETFHILETVWGIWYFLLWLFFGKGLLGLSSMSNSVFIRTGAIDESNMQVKSHDEEGRDNLDASISRNVPDIEVMFMPSSSVERAVLGHTFMSIYPTLVQPCGSGRVELVNTDSLSQPQITYPLFTNERDITSARLAVRFAMRLADELQHSGYPHPIRLAFAPGQDPSILDEWENSAPVDYLPGPEPVVPSILGVRDSQVAADSKQRITEGLESRMNKTWKSVTDDEIDIYMRRVSHTSLHFSGTCPMSNDEKSGVVDQELRVHGFSNLRIADTSVFPKIPSCHTMAPVMAVAERCVDLVKAAWKERKSQ
ncbi:putative GMC oxidoreductase [Annulohypoxylon truncatum]|uniref:putative GMC oxidoreductase n=1 Tax=Annulohypoxylon truncatum TaxID=327061 RepID=UPI002008784E|nr:putative GMC oxidoreductase [Annulohypoxylon truncatum]KAI1210115.1 putative GMC oxidoreductase [Annulohypoxylon truncatum]